MVNVMVQHTVVFVTLDGVDQTVIRQFVPMVVLLFMDHVIGQSCYSIIVGLFVLKRKCFIISLENAIVPMDGLDPNVTSVFLTGVVRTNLQALVQNQMNVCVLDIQAYKTKFATILITQVCQSQVLLVKQQYTLLFSKNQMIQDCFQGNVLEMEIVTSKVFAAKEIACVYLDILETNVNVSHQ